MSSIKTWKSPFYQRIRWAGDANVMWKFNLAFFLMVLSTFIINALSLILIYYQIYIFAVILLIIKFLLELNIYRLGVNIFSQTVYYLDFFIWFLITPFYVIIIGIGSFVNPKWRGASIN